MSLINELRTASSNTTALLKKQKEKLIESLRYSANNGNWSYTISKKEMASNEDEILNWLRKEGFTVTGPNDLGYHEVSWANTQSIHFVSEVYNLIHHARLHGDRTIFVKTEDINKEQFDEIFDAMAEKGYTLTPHCENGIDGMKISGGTLG